MVPSDRRVEQLAAESGVSVATIRYYQSRKLLPPPRRDGRIGWYDDAHLRRLERIRDLAGQGFSLTQIGRLLDDSGGGADPVHGALIASRPRPELDRDELAATTGTPRLVVDLLVSAGLLVPATVRGEERFDRDAIGMLDAAAALARTGAPLDRLLSLAQRHHAHVESVVDEAVRLVHDSATRSGVDRAGLAASIERLVPAAAGLVGAHFRRALLDRALAEVGPSSPVHIRLIELDRPDIDGLDLFDRVAGPDSWRVLWHHPERDVTLAAAGAAVVLDGGDSPTGRFTGTAAALEDLRRRVDLDAPPGAPVPTLVGGFAFAETHAYAADPRWAPLGPGALVLPEICLVQRGGSTWLQLAIEEEPTGLDRLADRAGELVGRSRGHDGGSTLVSRTDPSVDPAYEHLVAEGLDAIAAGRVDKVVLARSVEFRGSADVTDALDRLRTGNPGCVTFAFGYGSTCFLGATPELLVDSGGGRVRTTAVAGTRSRHPDPSRDDEIATGLLADAKEQSEHRFVVEHLCRALAEAGVRLDPVPDVSVERFSAVMHLVTRLEGAAALGAGGLVGLLGQLHPTPAVGGTPVGRATEWIATHEGLDRGWYAGPIGVVDLDGNGEFWVALRSALVHDEGAVAYVGAGVVDGSDPALELAETTAKLRTVAAAFGMTLP